MEKNADLLTRTTGVWCESQKTARHRLYVRFKESAASWIQVKRCSAQLKEDFRVNHRTRADKWRKFKKIPIEQGGFSSEIRPGFAE